MTLTESEVDWHTETGVDLSKLTETEIKICSVDICIAYHSGVKTEIFPYNKICMSTHFQTRKVNTVRHDTALSCAIQRVWNLVTAVVLLAHMVSTVCLIVFDQPVYSLFLSFKWFWTWAYSVNIDRSTTLESISE